MVAEQAKPQGIAHSTARAVPHNAICSVTTISCRYRLQSLKLGGKKPEAYFAMLPASRTRSPGRMSAPFQDAARSASAARQQGEKASAQHASPLLLRLGELRVQVGELAVDFRELRLLLRRRHVCVGFELALLAEELELADRQELGVGRLFEADPLLDAEQVLALLFLRPVREEEGLQLRLEP